MLHLRTFRECESVLYINAQIANGPLIFVKRYDADRRSDPICGRPPPRKDVCAVL